MPRLEEKVKATKVAKEKKAVTKDSMKASSDPVIVEKGSVFMEKSVTKNMGNFNSAKVSVAITLPFNPTTDDIESAKKTIRIADEILDKEIVSQVDKLDKGGE